MYAPDAHTTDGAEGRPGPPHAQGARGPSVAADGQAGTGRLRDRGAIVCPLVCSRSLALMLSLTDRALASSLRELFFALTEGCWLSF